MIHGIDTGFLVALEVSSHVEHKAARAELDRILKANDRLALVPQVLLEFIHVVTDPKRFPNPLSMTDAREIADRWWTAREVDQVYPNLGAVRQFFQWVEQHQLGRKRLLDTLLAATYREANIHSLITTNARDFGVLGGFTCIVPKAATIRLSPDELCTLAEKLVAAPDDETAARIQKEMTDGFYGEPSA